MSHRKSFYLLLLVLNTALGCASVRPSLPVAEDISEQRRSQRETVIAQYEAKRNEAMLAAAGARIEEGDDKSAEELLKRLLSRDEQLAAARLLLADIYILRGQFELANAQIGRVLQDEPANAAALHAAGLLLEASGHGEESRQYYAEAARLEPGNKLFVLSSQTADQLNSKVLRGSNLR